jgi:hypothetical protein
MFLILVATFNHVISDAARCMLESIMIRFVIRVVNIFQRCISPSTGAVLPQRHVVSSHCGWLLQLMMMSMVKWEEMVLLLGLVHHVEAGRIGTKCNCSL